MTVYLVCDGAEYEEGDNSDSVWTTAELAEKRCEELRAAGFVPFCDEMTLDERPDRVLA